MLKCWKMKREEDVMMRWKIRLNEEHITRISNPFQSNNQAIAKFVLRVSFYLGICTLIAFSLIWFNSFLFLYHGRSTRHLLATSNTFIALGRIRRKKASRPIRVSSSTNVKDLPFVDFPLFTLIENESNPIWKWERDQVQLKSIRNSNLSTHPSHPISPTKACLYIHLGDAPPTRCRKPCLACSDLSSSKNNVLCKNGIFSLLYPARTGSIQNSKKDFKNLFSTYLPFPYPSGNGIKKMLVEKRCIVVEKKKKIEEGKKSNR